MVQKEIAAAREDGTVEEGYWWKRGETEKESCRVPPRPGQTCPECGEGTLAYDGLFILTCDRCGYVAESGASW